MKKMSNRKMMSVREDILNSALTLLLFFKPMVFSLVVWWFGSMVVSKKVIDSLKLPDVNEASPCLPSSAQYSEYPRAAALPPIKREALTP
jgi:hypothetical protein